VCLCFFEDILGNACCGRGDHDLFLDKDRHRDLFYAGHRHIDLSGSPMIYKGDSRVSLL
jgi:hypothetical protein